MFPFGGASGPRSASPPSPPPTVPWAQQAHAYIASHEVPAGHLSNVIDNELSRSLDSSSTRTDDEKLQVSLSQLPSPTLTSPRPYPAIAPPVPSHRPAPSLHPSPRLPSSPLTRPASPLSPPPSFGPPPLTLPPPLTRPPPMTPPIP